MTDTKESEVLSLLQPDLLTVDELLEKISYRCSRIKNLKSMPKERLVGIFRQIILPFPQRIYRSNRRGKMLTSRRANAGLDSRRKEERCSFSNERLKPPPDISNGQKIQITSAPRKNPLESVTINDRRKVAQQQSHDSKNPNFSAGGNFLKRPYGYQHSGSPSQQQQHNKRSRTAIRWP